MRNKQMQKEEKARLRREMTQMVNEANSIRDEAAEKMNEVPKGYKLNSVRDDIRFWVSLVVDAVLCIVFLALFRWSLSGEDTVHLAVMFGCVVALGIGTVVASAIKNRPYRVEEHVRDYYVNDVHYDALAKELTRLKTGIADYNRQHDKRSECVQIQKCC